MKLLLDENLSRRMIPFLQADYPGSTQIALLGMERATDREVWEYAKANGFVLVTKDSDFHELSVLLGAPPKIIWMKGGNQSKAVMLNELHLNRTAIEKALIEDDKICVEIY